MLSGSAETNDGHDSADGRAVQISTYQHQKCSSNHTIDSHIKQDHRTAFVPQIIRSTDSRSFQNPSISCKDLTASGQQTCREAGAFQQWTKKQSDDPVFKAYRKEYKKRFAWIKAGRITDEQFYAWSEQAREMKKKCDREVITLDEFKDWLGKP